MQLSIVANVKFCQKSLISDLKGNKNVDWSRPKWKKFIRLLRKMSWEKLRGDGIGFWKIVEHLNEYKEGGIEEGWDALKGYYGIN